MKIIEGKLDAAGLKFGIIVSRFNEFITSKLLSGAIDCLKRNNADDDNITVIWTPGAFEIPAIATRMVQSKKYDAIICLGTVIRGATPHFDYVSAEVTKGIGQLSLKSEIPVILECSLLILLNRQLKEQEQNQATRGLTLPCLLLRWQTYSNRLAK